MATTATIVPVGKVRVGPLLGLPDLSSRFGVPFADLLADAGLPADLLSSAENVIDVPAVDRLLAAGVKRTACPSFGLLLGGGVRLRALGLAGALAQNAIDVGSAIRGLILNLHLNGHAMIPTLIVDQDLVELDLRLFQDVKLAHGPSTDFMAASSYSVVRDLCGQDFHPLEVLLAREPPLQRAPYTDLFGAPVRFAEDRTALIFTQSWLNQPVAGASPARRAVLEREVAVAMHRQSLPPEVAARRALFACLALGDVSVGRVAGMMGLHPRALNRQLAARGTTLAALLKDVRYQVARELLAIETLPITEIATTLRYADLASFTRAFRSWSGTSPLAWRKAKADSIAMEDAH